MANTGAKLGVDVNKALTHPKKHKKAKKPFKPFANLQDGLFGKGASKKGLATNVSDSFFGTINRGGQALFGKKAKEKGVAGAALDAQGQALDHAAGAGGKFLGSAGGTKLLIAGAAVLTVVILVK